MNPENNNSSNTDNKKNIYIYILTLLIIFCFCYKLLKYINVKFFLFFLSIVFQYFKQTNNIMLVSIKNFRCSFITFIFCFKYF